MLAQHHRGESDRRRHLDRHEQRGRRRADEADALEEGGDREDRADERGDDQAGEPGRPADGSERAEQAARDEERGRSTGGQVGGQGHRVGVAQQPIGEKDVQGVCCRRAERHPDPDQVGVHSGSADERDTAEDADERDEPAPRQRLPPDHCGHADDEHEARIVDE